MARGGGQSQAFFGHGASLRPIRARLRHGLEARGEEEVVGAAGAAASCGREVALRGPVTAVLGGQAHFAPAADLRNGVDGGVGVGTDGVEDVVDREAFEGRDWGRCGLGRR